MQLEGAGAARDGEGEPGLGGGGGKVAGGAEGFAVDTSVVAVADAAEGGLGGRNVTE